MGPTQRLTPQFGQPDRHPSSSQVDLNPCLALPAVIDLASTGNCLVVPRPLTQEHASHLSMASSGQEPSSGETPSSTSPNGNDDLSRKRARDRKSQQAMRDRTKWQIQNLSEQVRYLTQVVCEKDEENRGLLNRVRTTETELEQLRVQDAALRLRLMGQPPADTMCDMVPRWQIPPSNVPSTCMADQIIQNFILSGRAVLSEGDEVSATSPGGTSTIYADKPNLCSLLNKDHRAQDVLSNVAGDIVFSYKEIETLPKQVAVFHGITALLKWELLLDKRSWDQIPPYFRPITEQLTTPHAAWIDRIAWPRVRRYLIYNPSITLDDFAKSYSTNFSILWPYDASLVVIALEAPDGVNRAVVINPVFEQHLQQLSNWIVTDAFRARFPEISRLIDEEQRGD